MNLQEFIDKFILNDEPFYLSCDIDANGGWMARRTDDCKLYSDYSVLGVKALNKGQLCVILK